MGYRLFLVAVFTCMFCLPAIGDDELDFLLEVEEPQSDSTEETSEPGATSPARQQEDAESNQPAPKAKPRVLEEIVVTAQKTQQTLQEVPVAVSVVDGSRLRDAGVFGAEGIEDLVPNLELDGDAQAPTIGIRGFSTDGYNVGLEPSVGIIVDEVALGRSEFIPDGLFDIERVEVLRGPQGTLFGKNTIAGVLIFATGSPTDELSANLGVTSGENDTRRIEGNLNIPVYDTLLTRGAFVDWHDGGEVRNSFLNRRELQTDQSAGRLKFEINPSDRLRLRFGGQASDTETTYSGWQLYKTDPDALAYARTKDPNTEDNPFDAHTSFDLPGFVNRETEILHLIADYQLTENIDVSLIQGKANLINDILMDFDVSAADLARVKADFNHDQDTLELRFVGDLDAPFDTRMEFVAGLFSFTGEMDIAIDVSLGEDIAGFGISPAGQEALGSPGLPEELGPLGDILLGIPVPAQDLGDGVNQLFVQESSATAAFGQVTWFFAENWSTVLGLRFGKEEKDAVLMVQDRGPGITSAVLQSENFTQPLSREEDEVSPKFGLSYDITPDISSYLSWTRGFKGGGFNAISFQNQNLSFEPEQGDNTELGIKSRLLDDALEVNFTLYNTDVTDMQVVNFNGIGFDVFNAAEARLRGLETDLRWLTPLEWLTINAAFSLSEAEYESYPNAPTPAGSEAEEQDLSGKTLPRAPDTTASLSPQITIPVMGNLIFNMGFNISHRGRQFLALDLDPVTEQEAYTLYDAYFGFGADDGMWSFALRGENLTEVEALSFVADHNLYSNSYFSTQIPLKRVSLSFNANW